MNPSPKIEELVFQAVSKLETEGESAFRAFVEEHPGDREDLLRMVRRLTGMGVGVARGDVVAVQLPSLLQQFLGNPDSKDLGEL